MKKIPLIPLVFLLICNFLVAQDTIDEWLFDDGTNLKNTSNSGSSGTAWAWNVADGTLGDGVFQLSGGLGKGVAARHASPLPLSGTVRFEVVISEWDFSAFSTGANSQRVFVFSATDGGGTRLARIQVVYDNGEVSITADQGAGSFRKLGSLSLSGNEPTTVSVSLDLATEKATFTVSGALNNSFSGITTKQSRTASIKDYQIGRYGKGAFDQSEVYLKIDSISLKAGESPTPISLHPLFRENSVLQRDKEIPVWGKAAAGETVNVYLDDVLVGSTVADAEENWKVGVGPFPGDGGIGHKLAVSSPNSNLFSVTLNEIVFGDVYILSGQSNMDWPISKSYFPESEQAGADLPLIRQIRQQYATSPEELSEPNLLTGWVSASPATVSDFSGVGFFLQSSCT